MRLLIATSAFSNEDLLLDCVNSWPRHPDVGAAVYFDGLHYKTIFQNTDKIPGYIHQIRPEIPEHVGCAGSWNRLLQYWYMESGARHILFVGSDTMMTPLFSMENMLDELEKRSINYAEIKGLLYNSFCISRKAFESIGTFDENFYPAYYEDGDYHQRAMRAKFNLETIGKSNWVLHRYSQTIKRSDKFKQANHLTFEMNKARYLRKWGGHPYIDGTESHTTPYNDPTQSIKDWVLDEEEHKKKFDIWNN